MEELSRVLLMHNGPAPTQELAALGYAVEVIPGGVEALRRLAQAPDVAMVAVAPSLPDADPGKIVQALAAANPALPVILLTEDPDIMGASALATALGAATAPGAPAPAPATPAALCLLRIAEEAHMAEAFRSLNAAPGVMECLAMRGSYNLLLTIDAPGPEAAKTLAEAAVKPLHGVADMVTVTVTAPPVDDDLRPFTGPLAASPAGNLEEFALIEAGAENLAGIFERLYFHPAVTACFATDGDFNLVARVGGYGFKEIEAVISRDIRPLDGIVRVRGLKALRMFDM